VEGATVEPDEELDRMNQITGEAEYRGTASDTPWVAPDGTEWVFSPGLDVWGGWKRGDDAVQTATPAQFADRYPGWKP